MSVESGGEAGATGPASLHIEEVTVSLGVGINEALEDDISRATLDVKRLRGTLQVESVGFSSTCAANVGMRRYTLKVHVLQERRLKNETQSILTFPTKTPYN